MKASPAKLMRRLKENLPFHPDNNSNVRARLKQAGIPENNYSYYWTWNYGFSQKQADGTPYLTSIKELQLIYDSKTKERSTKDAYYSHKDRIQGAETESELGQVLLDLKRIAPNTLNPEQITELTQLTWTKVEKVQAEMDAVA